ncbi:phage baseplate protein [Phytobacter ursingii]
MDILSTLLRPQSRKIGVIIPDVVVSEKHSDALEITEHPVETGAAISDHAYKRPSEVVMEVGFAGGGALLDFANELTGTSLLGMSPRETYQQLLDLQSKREPFDVVTGKRIYNNMLIRVLEVTTDKATENVLSAVVTLREVIITSTAVVQVANKTDMKEGVNTSPTQNSGTKTTVPKNESLLSTFTGWFQ